MLNINLMKAFDMLVYRHHNAIVMSEDSFVVADSGNKCYVFVEYIDGETNKFFRIELVCSVTSKTVDTAYDTEYHGVVSVVEKMLNYSNLYIECKNTSIRDNYKLTISVIGSDNEIMLSLIKNPGVNCNIIKVLPITLYNGRYETGYCKTDYAEYSSEIELIQDFLRGVSW